MKKISNRIFNISPFCIPFSGNLAATSLAVLVEDMILEPDEANGVVRTAHYITPDVIKIIDVGGQDLGNYVLTREDTACTECSID